MVAIPFSNFTARYDGVYKLRYIELNLNGVKIKNGKHGVKALIRENQFQEKRAYENSEIGELCPVKLFARYEKAIKNSNISN